MTWLLSFFPRARGELIAKRSLSHASKEPTQLQVVPTGLFAQFLLCDNPSF